MLQFWLVLGNFNMLQYQMNISKHLVIVTTFGYDATYFFKKFGVIKFLVKNKNDDSNQILVKKHRFLLIFSYFRSFLRPSKHTVSTCEVLLNKSHGVTSFNSYPFSSKIFISLAAVDIPHDI